MTVAEVGVVTAGVVIAVGLWVFMFRLVRCDIWPRTWVAAAALATYSVVTTALRDDARTLVGRVSLAEVLIGAAIGVLWVATTHLGAALLGRVVPSFGRQTSDLYRLANRSTAARVAGPLVAMAIAEELFFRGLIQARAGLVAAVVIYAGVQLVEGKWALVAAAALGGLVWGGLFCWREGLIAPSIAHALWTVTLTLVWPIRSAAHVAPAPRTPG